MAKKKDTKAEQNLENVESALSRTEMFIEKKVKQFSKRFWNGDNFFDFKLRFLFVLRFKVCSMDFHYRKVFISRKL